MVTLINQCSLYYFLYMEYRKYCKVEFGYELLWRIQTTYKSQKVAAMVVLFMISWI